ncbi:unnamed protein product [Heligmosomoides polygyrus]|uniref:Rx_N domain-containing protein n=1 Tax=Heligmosomoides polygyrus TaxID=6339 RepID=A0A183F705_HELPZ|nr:unnamed protein product [Heligmosomoides polygyrus]
MDVLPALLQAVQRQLDLQARCMEERGAAIVKLMEKLSALPAINSPLVVKDKHAIFDSLHRRIERFCYDPERERTFDLWLKRYQEMLDNGATSLRKGQNTTTRFLPGQGLLPKTDCSHLSQATIKLSWDEILEMRYKGQEFNNYELLVKTKCANAKLDTIDFDGLQCLVYVAGFQRPEFADYRIRLLRKLDQFEMVTLEDLTAECQIVQGGLPNA